MIENKKQQIVFAAMKDIYKEFNQSVNNLLILRDFLNDVFNYSEGSDGLGFDYPSIDKLN